MTKAIITDVNRCVGCLACSVACKAVNSVPIGNYWNKVVRVGPNPIPGGSGQYPDVYMYFLPISCQPLRRPLPQRGGEGRREVHAVRAEAAPRRAAPVR